MVIKWTNFAKRNLYDFQSHSRINDVKDYIKSLVAYVQSLEQFENMGKLSARINSIELRQLIASNFLLYF